MARRALYSLGILIWLGTIVVGQKADPRSQVLIRAAKPYASLVARVESLGGRVTYQYQYLNAIAAELPAAAQLALASAVAGEAITKDEELAEPGSLDMFRLRGLPVSTSSGLEVDAVDALGADDITALATATPDAYRLNNTIANVASLHAAGTTGAGSIVAVIDSGIRPGFPHISLDGSVIGCEDFVGDALGCTNSANNFHGTFVAGMISANVTFVFPPTSTVRNAVLAECPACFSDPPANTRIPMIGTAPLSSIYALRVFGPTGGTPTSRALKAIDRVIELRTKYDAGQPGGRNIKVVNMSFGGATTFAGHNLLDEATDLLLEHGIVPVIAAGNDGPSSLTVSSPGTSRSAITVGAASLAHNDRILARLQLGPVLGALYRPFSGVQMAYFSSRGPDANGSGDPDLVSNGVACYGQGFGSTGNITFASGTSFATPSVAGVAALLVQKYPAATAREIRDAIISSANPNVISDGSTGFDQGRGYVDGAAASALIASGDASDDVPTLPQSTKNVPANLAINTSLHVADGVVFEHAADLKPGQRHEILYKVTPNTRQVVVALSNVTPALPPAEQNQLFGDDILIAIQSAKTSAADYKAFEFSLGKTYTIDNPEQGLLRVTLNGDWTNAGTISADVSIASFTDPLPQFTTQSKIVDKQMVPVPIRIPPGISKAEFRLSWREDWGNYPTSNLDLIVISPTGVATLTGATLNAPEQATITNPAAGVWTALVTVFGLDVDSDKFELRVSLDGKVAK
jgi:subtilisin family serine protease